jgi:hypothetical protein
MGGQSRKKVYFSSAKQLLHFVMNLPFYFNIKELHEQPKQHIRQLHISVNKMAVHHLSGDSQATFI